MFRLFDQAQYDLLRIWKTAFAATAAFTIPGILLLAIRGLNQSIEFTGGTLIQVQVANPDIRTAELRAALTAGGITGAEIQTFGQRFGTPDEFVIRARLDPRAEVTGEATQETRAAVDSALAAAFGPDSYEIQRTEAVGPKVGGELRARAQAALLMALGAIFLVIWFRYEWRFSMAAVLATVHDVISTLAFISYLNLEVTLVVVAALLTIIGYSLNDTIVTFDRVRENLRKFKRQNIYEILNRSINETLPRTILTSGTTLGATLALLILGGGVIRGFAWVMTFGIITGTFSSIFIASPVLLVIERRWPGEDVRGAKPITPRAAPIVT
ncbi:MAG: protein translocase subunit SecF [Gemmatimonadales bacterium]|nr:protein translocase subunit SecF [Gemmatimonadales bacterium]NIN50191.1 protein translocase subunit SecF [Gemmatimonadales bacterium]NIP07655.1 protein translocase subunit SecF [Gemmatimonadales bacterium]NIR01807.1 protein translocase subunit SecF [Gemmatimonadales bacterium]NIS65710.1 protein translocase subunit SecF [Gemmatimonadales bacterium]